MYALGVGAIVGRDKGPVWIYLPDVQCVIVADPADALRYIPSQWAHSPDIHRLAVGPVGESESLELLVNLGTANPSWAPISPFRRDADVVDGLVEVERLLALDTGDFDASWSHLGVCVRYDLCNHGVITGLRHGFNLQPIANADRVRADVRGQTD